MMKFLKRLFCALNPLKNVYLLITDRIPAKGLESARLHPDHHPVVPAGTD
jgi:hypothetical protein